MIHRLALLFLLITTAFSCNYVSTSTMTYSFDQINTQNHESAYFSARNQLRQSYAEREYAFQLTQLQQDYHRSLYARSPLPPGFCDNFSTMRWWEEFTTTYGDFAEYCKEWQNFVRKHNFSDKERQDRILTHRQWFKSKKMKENNIIWECGIFLRLLFWSPLQKVMLKKYWSRGVSMDILILA